MDNLREMWIKLPPLRPPLSATANGTGRYFNLILGGILLIYVVLGIQYTLATPPLEASDEYKHYPVVQYIQNTHRLPVLDPSEPGRWLQEGAQPPLYYLLMAALTSGIDTRDLPVIHQVNHHAFVGDPNQIRNKNLVFHDPARDRFPGQGSIRAIYVIRLASLGLGLVTLWLTARLGYRLFSPSLALTATALTAFNPMFLFVHAAVNNDSLAILWGAWGLYWLVDLAQTMPDPRHAWGRYVRLGVVLGLGLLTKLSLGALLGLTGVVLGWQAWRARRPSILLLGGGLVVLSAGLVSVAWFVRNWQIYGDLTGLDVFIQVQGRRTEALTWSGWWAEFGTFYRSFWGLFGGVNISAPTWFYTVCNGLAVIGGVGWVVWLVRQRGHLSPGVWLALGWAGCLFLLLLRWTFIYPAFQGRLLFPALGAINLLWAAGLRQVAGLGAWVHRKPATGRLWLPTATSGFLLVNAAWLPTGAIQPAYAFPQPLAGVPTEARYGPITFAAPDGQLQLVGVELTPGQTTWPGANQPIALTLYWQAIKPVHQDYLSAVAALGRNYQAVGSLNRHPAWGMVPTSQWQIGQIWRDEYRLFINRDAPAPARLRIHVSLFDVALGQDLPAQTADGDALSLVIVGEARLAAWPESVPAPAQVLSADFGDGIVLEGYTWQTAAASPTITLTWQAVAIPSQAYTVFVHLLGPDGLLATGDSPPLNDDYPTTWWQTGDRVPDPHVINLPTSLPPGDYRIAVGLYDPVTLARLIRPDGSDSVSWSFRWPLKP